MGFFKNYRVYILTSVAYLGSLLFGMSNVNVQCGVRVETGLIRGWLQVMILV